MRATALPLQLSVQFATPVHRPLLPRPTLRHWVRAALGCGPGDATPRESAALPASAQITLRFVDADEGRELNRTYRHKDYATNVLTFDYRHWPPAADIVLCADVVAREAAAQGKTLQAHYAHLVVHGVLHALGWDHERPADAERMEGAERKALALLGFPDPYATGDEPKGVARATGRTRIKRGGAQRGLAAGSAIAAATCEPHGDAQARKKTRKPKSPAADA
ncbi:MAG: rRNA maturation RNase YbeY [Betaproteobacteria bacterium]|nr:rRNA maturation RNase YbeY [Betaproteobacteria bacterium]